MQMPKFEHTYKILHCKSYEELEAKVNELLSKEYLLAGEFRIYENEFYQPMMYSIMAEIPVMDPEVVEKAKIIELEGTHGVVPEPIEEAEIVTETVPSTDAEK